MHYHWLSVLPVLSAVLLVNLTMPPATPWGDIRVMHAWNAVPADWESLGPPPSDTTIDIHIALMPHREDALIEALNKISDPKHQNYEQVADLVAPHQDTLGFVHSWLEHHGVPSSSISTSHGGGWLTIAGTPVSQADELLCASYQLYRHTGMNETEAILRTVSYALPLTLHAHVQTVAPTTYFASLRMPLLQTPYRHSSEEAVVTVNATSGRPVRALSERDGYITPPFLRWLYKTQAYTPAAMGQNVLGTLGFIEDYPSPTDLTQFMINFRADADAATFTVVEVNGGEYDASHAGVAGSISTQYAEAISYPTPHIYYITGGMFWRLSRPRNVPAPGDAYLEWLNYLLALQNIPPTINIPYSNTEVYLPRAYARALCRLFAQLGTRGISVLAASGDDGVGRGDCISRRPSKRVRFIPEFPASCPWVTSVGGTTGHDPEVAAVLSGGGFSRHFERPSYQKTEVSAFLKLLGPMYDGFYSSGGRGIPDISSQAQRFSYIRNAAPYIVNSTMCSTSTAAGIVSLLNDYMLSRGEAPLGFLNPWLYSHGLQTLNDITSGNNPGCNTNGFAAVPGWDPVTGLGTLDFEILQAVLDQSIDSDSDDSDPD